MTTIKVENNFIEVSGHSGYATVGTDIVCAAISTLSEATYNYLIATNNKVILEEKDAYYKMVFEKLNEAGKAIKTEFISMVDDLMSQYPKNIRRIK